MVVSYYTHNTCIMLELVLSRLFFGYYTQNLKEIQQQKGFWDKENLLNSTITKIKALSRKSLNKIENVLEILLQTEGYAVRQTPNHNIDINTLSAIREAMKANTCKYL